MCPGFLESCQETRRGKLTDMFKPQFLSVSLALITAVFAGNFVYYGAIYAEPLLLQYAYCNGGNATADSCLMTDSEFFWDFVICAGEFLSIPIFISDSEFFWDFVICAGEFLSIPIFIFSSEWLGRVRAALVVSSVMMLFVIACEYCIDYTVLIIELMIERSLANAFLLLVYIYTPEFYPTYIRSVAFGFIMTFSAWGGILSMINVYIVGLDTSWMAMWYVFWVFGFMVVASTFWFGRETVGVRLEDNRPETVMSVRSSRASMVHSRASNVNSRAGNLEEGGGPGVPPPTAGPAPSGVPPKDVPPPGVPAPSLYPKVSPGSSPGERSPIVKNEGR
eukprot:sb/3466559/